MQHGMNSLLNTSPTSSSSSQIPLPNHHHHPHFHPGPASSSSNVDFLDQMLSAIPSPSPWSDLHDTSLAAPHFLHDENNTSNNPNPAWFHAFDDPSLLASKISHHHIGGAASGTTSSATASVAKILLQQQLLMAAATRAGRVPQNDPLLVGSPLKSPSQGGEMHALYNNGFASGSPPTTGQQHFHHPQNFGVMNQQQEQQPQASGSTTAGGDGGGAPAQQPKQRVRARRGQATDPHSIAERLRRERIAERMKALQELVPNANKTDKASMLDEIIDYVKFLQLQVKVLSMSRLGGAAAVGPLVADMSSEGAAGGGDCIQAASNGNQTASSGDNLTVTEHQVVKLMEEDMGSAMQYLQGKGLCLMPISLATAISTAAKCPPAAAARNSLISGLANNNSVTNNNNNNGHHQHQLHQSNNGEGPSSPKMSVLTVQSATVSSGAGGGSIKDVASISKP